ncbi:putative neural cell adhesion molecule l1 [Trichonephila clavata]|uniref:Putative neural cell adhesion molecule l1 n=1 Tax=Trichonephila clavata TaxID=2740835 RepID=A0A8X6FK55_TRICU|nr:putative neural cell adhesion molecule l1 [Trichonephila clavata]
MRFSHAVCSNLDLATDLSCEKADIRKSVSKCFELKNMDAWIPPDIIEELSSSDIITREGSNVTLKCTAKGHPEPKLSWCHEDYKSLGAGNWQNNNLDPSVIIHEGNILSVSKVSRLHMGAYICYASNGVPPAASRRIMLQVNFPPTIWIPNQLVGANLGSNVTLECNTEGYPESINYWMRHDSEIISHGGKYDVILKVTNYKKIMFLQIRNVAYNDYGIYRCFAHNSLGEREGSIHLYATGDVDPNYREDKVKLRKSNERSSNETSIKMSGKEEVIDSGKPRILYGIFQAMIFATLTVFISYLLCPGT